MAFWLKVGVGGSKWHYGWWKYWNRSSSKWISRKLWNVFQICILLFSVSGWMSWEITGYVSKRSKWRLILLKLKSKFFWRFKKSTGLNRTLSTNTWKNQLSRKNDYFLLVKTTLFEHVCMIMNKNWIIIKIYHLHHLLAIFTKPSSFPFLAHVTQKTPHPSFGLAFPLIPIILPDLLFSR